METLNKPSSKKIDVILGSDINAFARIIDLFTMLAMTPSKLTLTVTEQGNYHLCVWLTAQYTDAVFYPRFKQKLGAFDFVLQLIEEDEK